VSAAAGDLRDRVAATGLLPAGAPVVVGCSGGRDSLCLLDLAAALAGADAVLAVHVHHGLRDRDADRDAVHVAAQARRLGVAARVLRLAPPATGAGAAWARDARRAALLAAAERWSPGSGRERRVRVLLGHTVDDQVETLVLRAISSPGIRALAGMAVQDAEGRLARPLLAADVDRRATAAWCAARGIAWREDPSNPRGPRGRVRALLRAAQAIDGRATAALHRTASRAREDDEALRAAAAALVAPVEPGAPLPVAVLAGAPTAIARRALRLLAERAVGRPCPRVEARLEEVLALTPGVGGGPATAALDVGDGVRVVRTPDGVACEPLPSRS